MELWLMIGFVVGVAFAAAGAFLAGVVLSLLVFRHRAKGGMALLFGMALYLTLSSFCGTSTKNAASEPEKENPLRVQAETFFNEQGGASFAMLKRVLLGAEGKETFPLQDDMRTLGLAHLLAASGLHVHLLFTWGMALLSWSPLSRRHIACLVLLLLFGYAAFLSFPASILRAWLFLVFREGAVALRKNLDPRKAWLFALCLILLVMPQKITNLGLQMSFLCAAAGEAVNSMEHIHERGGILRRSFRRSLWISLFTLPVLAHAGIAQTPSTLLANLLAIPAFSLLFALGMLSILGTLLAVPVLSEVVTMLYRFAYGFFALLLKGLMALALPGVTFSFTGEGLAFYVLLVLLLLAAQLGWLRRIRLSIWKESEHGDLFWRRRMYLLRVLSLWLMLTVLRATVLSTLLSPSVEALDVGQGDCFLVRYGTQAVLVDTGGKKDFRTGKNTQGEKVVRMLRERGVHRLQRIFLSHDDYDHDGNLPEILKRMPVGEVVTAPAARKNTFPDSRLGNSHRQANIGQRWFLENGLPWCKPMIFTALQAGQWDAEDKNNHGLVLYLDFGGGVLFMGDQEQDEGVSRAVPSRIALLKVAHHGSKRGTSDALLSAIRPEQALISCGIHNRYGHPAPSTISRLQRHGIPYRRTDEEGSLLYQENLFPWGMQLCVYTEKQQRNAALLLEILWSLPLIVAIKAETKEALLRSRAERAASRCKAPARY